MRCDYCKYELQQDDYYWDFEFADVVICEECLGDFLSDLEEKHRKVNELVDYQYDSWKDDKALEEIMKER